jgi:hypothetical protein
MIDNSIYIADVMFPDELCDKVIDIFNNKTKLLGENHFIKNSNGLKRKDKALFLDDPELEVYQDLGNIHLATDINYYLGIALEEYSDNFSAIKSMSIRSTRQKLQKTKIGGGYHEWHNEQFNVDSSSRILTWSIYLNNVEEGGETEFLHQSKRIKAKKGKILIFPASFTHTHRGNPPLSSDKYILTGWWDIV